MDKKPLTSHNAFDFQPRFLSSIVDQVADNIMITDVNGLIEYVNPAFENHTGYIRDEILGLTPRILRSGLQDDTYYQKLWQTILAGQNFRAVVTNRKKTGEIYYADQTITPIKNDQGLLTHFVSFWKDITPLVDAQSRLAVLNKELGFEKGRLEAILAFDGRISSQHRLETLFDLLVQEASNILGAEKCSLMLLDDTTMELCIKSAKGLSDDVIGTARVKESEGIAGQIVRLGTEVLVEDIEQDSRFRRQNNKEYKSRSFISVPIYGQNRILGVVNVADKRQGIDAVFTHMDLKVLKVLVRQTAIAIENAYLYRKLKFLTTVDPLTNIYNYRHFVNVLDQEIKRSCRYRTPLGLIFMDIDDFKSYNDTFGHLEGDALLKKIAQVIQSCMRATDVVCRYAGDEFSIVLPQTGIEESEHVAQRILEGVRCASFASPVSVSMGVVKHFYPTNRYEFIRKADAALYSAKNAGKNQVCVYVTH